MTGKEFDTLKIGDKVKHKHFGVMTVVDYIPEFGPLLTADEKEGCIKLAELSGMPFGTPLLGGSKRLIQKV